jgi:hypothetical protein
MDEREVGVKAQDVIDVTTRMVEAVDGEPSHIVLSAAITLLHYIILEAPPEIRDMTRLMIRNNFEVEVPELLS